jgi:hypothetical protein
LTATHLGHGDARIDGRTLAGRFLRDEQQKLRDSLPGEPTVAQLTAIENIAQMRYRRLLLDEKLARGEQLAPAEEKSYVSLASGITRALRALGLESPTPPIPKPWKRKKRKVPLKTAVAVDAVEYGRQLEERRKQTVRSR